jgi:multiple sugar transport system substrate-binding protein
MVRKTSLLLMIIILCLTLTQIGLAAEADISQEIGEGSIVIEYWNGFTGPDGETMREIIKAFVKDNPMYQVKMQIIPWDNYYDKLLAALAAGSGPDLFVLWHNIVPQYQSMGIVRPVDDMFERGLLPKDDFTAGPIEALTVDGHVWGIPLDNYGVGIYINTKLVKEAGLDPTRPPKDMAEFIAYANKLTIDKNGLHPDQPGFDVNNVEQYGFAIPWWRTFVQSLILQWGSNLVSEDGSEVLVNQDEALEAVQLATDLIHKYRVAPKPQGFDAWHAFGAGKLAMCVDGSWVYNWFKGYPEIEPFMWPIPQFGPKRPAAIMWSHTLLMPSTLDSAKVDAVQELIKYISDHSYIWTLDAGMPPARLSVSNTPELSDMWTVPLFIEQNSTIGVMEFAHPNTLEILSYVEAEMSNVLNGIKTPKAGMDDAARRIQRILK